MFPDTLEVLKRNLKSQGATEFRVTKRNYAIIGGTLVIVTRFKFKLRGKQMYGAWEPETGFYETEEKPIGKIS